MTQGPNYEQSGLAYGHDLQTIFMDMYTQQPWTTWHVGINYFTRLVIVHSAYERASIALPK
jgi:hypothetical protein